MEISAKHLHYAIVEHCLSASPDNYKQQVLMRAIVDKVRKLTMLLQLMHLRLGGSFMRPLIIFSLRSSSLLLPISRQLKRLKP